MGYPNWHRAVWIQADMDGRVNTNSTFLAQGKNHREGSSQTQSFYAGSTPAPIVLLSNDLHKARRFLPSRLMHLLGKFTENLMDRDMRNECYHCAHKRAVPGNAHIKCVKPDADMRGNQHGIKNGWFFYPLLFDPTWKEAMCKNYQNHESVKAVVSEPVSVAGESK